MKRDPAVETLLGDYYARQGRESPEEFIARHPQHAELLRQHFALDGLVQNAFAPRAPLVESLGPFRVERELGSGGMGTVYRAVVAEPTSGIEPGRTVALKVVHPHLFRTPGFFRRFLREAELGRRIDHPNVVRTYAADAVDLGDRPQHYLVMEYVEGRTLRDVMEEVERVPEELARHVGSEVAKALSAIHGAGAVHRDLKPENVLITADHVVKVMDLGVARLAEEQARLSQTGAFIGSLHYAAPEQFGGGADVDRRADLHGLGLLLYEITTGTNPFADENARAVMRRILSETPRKAGELNPQLSPFFEEVLARLLQKDPAARFQSSDEILEVLALAEESAWWRERSVALRATTHRALRRIRVQRETAVYGRDEELGRLRALYDAVRSGDGRVVLVDGEAGIGKTRLVDELVSRLQQEGEDVHFLFAGYPPGGVATASGAFTAAYREHLGDAGLDDALAALLPQTPLLVPAFAALLRGDGAPKGAQPLTKGALQTCFVHLTRNLAAERTTIVLIDDLHFAPEEGRALFMALALAVPGHRILLVGTMRHGVPEDWITGVTRLEHAQSVPLQRLGPKDLVRLLGDSFRSTRLAEELAGKIAVKSDGNPLFVFEIIRGLREAQIIRQRDDGSWESTGVIEDIHVPSSVLDLVNARVATLDDDDRDLLDVAACWGHEFDPSLVAAALGRARLPVLQRLARIESRERLVRSKGRLYVFDHHQVQEALYGALSEPLREEYHTALADALLAVRGAADADPATLDGELCVGLSEQLLRGTDSRRGARYVDAALEHLASRYAHERAVALAERALAVPELAAGASRARLLLHFSTSLESLGRRERQAAVLEEALRVARALGGGELLGDVLLAAAGVATRRGDPDAAKTLLDEARQLAATLGSKTMEASVVAGLATLHHHQGLVADAAECSLRHIELARELGDTAAEAGATVNLGNARCEQGRLDEALALYRRGFDLACAAGSRLFEGNAIGNQGVIHLYRGNLEEAHACFLRHVEICRAIGNRPGEAIATGNLGLALKGLRRTAESREAGAHALALLREVGDRAGVAIQLLQRAQAELDDGRCEDAIPLACEAIELARGMGARVIEANAHGVLGDLLTHQGRLAEARAAYERYVAIASEFGMRREEAHAHGVLGTVLASLGEHAVARREIERQLALLREHGDRSHEITALVQLGGLALAQNDVERAHAHYAQAVEVAEGIDAPLGAAQSLLARATTFERRGELSSARDDLQRARDRAAAAGAVLQQVLATCHLARLGAFDTDAAERLLDDCEQQIQLRSRMEAHFALFRATDDERHLTEAARLLQELVDRVPSEARAALIDNVGLHRNIDAAQRARDEAR